MRRERWPTVAAGTYSTTVTSSASTHTKGSWAQVAAATTFDAVLDTLVFGAGDAQLYLVDVGIGAAASEQIVLPDLMCGHGTSASTDMPSWRRLHCGLLIPAGTRLVGRCSSNGSSKRVLMAAELVALADWRGPIFTRAETYGTTLATTRGTSIDPGGSANTKGSYVQLTAATAVAARRWILSIGNQGNNAPGSFQWAFDLAIGSPGQIVVPDVWVLGASSGTGLATMPSTAVFDVSVPAGEAVSVRSMCNGTDATDRLLDVAVTALATA